MATILKDDKQVANYIEPDIPGVEDAEPVVQEIKKSALLASVEREFVQYIERMYNMENAHKCEGCPENCGFDDWEGKLPCGQQNCWVEIYNEEEI